MDFTAERCSGSLHLALEHLWLLLGQSAYKALFVGQTALLGAVVEG
jgi:hypothetical protein